MTFDLNAPTISYANYAMGIGAAMLAQTFIAGTVHWMLCKFSHVPKTSEEQPNVVVLQRHSGSLYATAFCGAIGLLIIMKYLAIGHILLSPFHGR